MKGKIVTHVESRKRRAEAVKLLRKGMMPDEVAKQLKLSIGYINLLAPDVIQTNKHRHDLEIIKMFRTGKTCSEVGKHFGLSAWYVQHIARAERVLPRRRPIHSWGILAALLNTNRSCADIAREFGLTQQGVHEIYQVARHHGIRVPVRLRTAR